MSTSFSSYETQNNTTSQANVLVSDNGRPLLCDFGLAVIVEDLTNMPISSALHDSGNPRWMAPELLAQGDIVSPKSDVWALGMVFLEVFLYFECSELTLT